MGPTAPRANAPSLEVLAEFQKSSYDLHGLRAATSVLRLAKACSLLGQNRRPEALGLLSRDVRGGEVVPRLVDAQPGFQPGRDRTGGRQTGIS